MGGRLGGGLRGSDKRRAPFMISIRKSPEEGGRQFPILMCMTNISYHDIRLDNAITKDILQVQDSTGKPPALMPDGLTLQQQFGSTGSTYSYRQFTGHPVRCYSAGYALRLFRVGSLLVSS